MHCNSAQLVNFYLIFLNDYLINKNKTVKNYTISRLHVVDSKNY